MITSTSCAIGALMEEAQKPEAVNKIIIDKKKKKKKNRIVERGGVAKKTREEEGEVDTNSLSLMGTLRGRLRKARKQITWCAFPLHRSRQKHQRRESADLYSSAIDIPASYGFEQRLQTIQDVAEEDPQLNPKDVGQTCRGSVNLQEARILSDKASGNIVISTASQTFHLKAPNETDRQEWIRHLEYARHSAIRRAESEEDEDAQLSNTDLSRTEALAQWNRQLSAKYLDLKTAAMMMHKQGDELVRALSNNNDLNRITLSERSELLKITTAAVLQAASEFVDMTDKSSKKLSKIVASEQKEKLMLQELLESLAKQHSSLEKAAENVEPVSAYSDQEDEFHDAEEEIIACNPSVSTSDDTDSNNSPTTMTHDNSSSSTAPVHSSRINPCASASADTSAKPRSRTRRTTVPERPDLPINLWSIMKNCIGKELSKIPMPVNFSEPISVLQRVTEDLEYAHLLETAAKLPPIEQICYVAAYAASNYSTTCHRTNKPFNPLLGETYEFDRMDDLGWRSITEQVSHHPPAAAHHAEGRGWTMYQDFTMTSKFRGKFLSVIPVGYTHVQFPATGSHFSYRKITTTVHNIIVGKLWIDNHGDMEIVNHSTGDKCVLKFIPYSYFSKEESRRVYGIVFDSTRTPKYVVKGTWDKSVDMYRIASWNGNADKPKVEIDESTVKRLWTATPLPRNADKMHNFTAFTIELNEPEEGVAPTDSRFRPDQRLMENGEWDEANRKKVEIEDKQRAVRRRRDAEMEKAMQRGEHYEEYQPTWFVKVQDEKNGALIHQYKGGYWEAKSAADWSKCPDIF